MTRYIDAEKFEKEMYHEAFETDSDMQKWDSGCWIRYKMFENCIAQQPTADVVEVVHGRWVEKEKYTFGIMYDCSLCEDRILDNGHPWNYCPNCGAKMDGGDNNSDNV